LDRTAPILPLMPGVPQRQSHDYQPNGTTDLFAALDVASGKVLTQMTDRHRAIEFRRFLNLINRNVPDHLDIHIVIDNVSSHKTPEIQRWLIRHPRFHIHFTPTYSSWMNLVERWFSELTTKWIQRGTLGFPSNRGGLLIDGLHSLTDWCLGAVGSPSRALRSLGGPGCHAARSCRAARSARICS
jgi:transposase